MLVMLVPVCGTSSPVSFATSARFSCKRPEIAAAALLSPASIAARKSPTAGRGSPSRPRSRRRLPRAGCAAYRPRAATAWSPAPRAFRQSGAPARAAKLHPVRPGSALPQPASKTQWRLRDQSAVAPGDCRSCSAARRSASSGNSHVRMGVLRGTRAAMSANSRCLASRRERKQKNLRHQNTLKKTTAKSWRGDAAALISATKRHYIKNTRG